MSMTRHRLLDNTYKKTTEGNPIVAKSVARMYPGLNLYGWSKQDGTPSPDNPIPIESAGSVMTTGAQLIPELQQGYIGWENGDLTGVSDVKFRSFVIDVTPGTYTFSSVTSLLVVR